MPWNPDENLVGIISVIDALLERRPALSHLKSRQAKINYSLSLNSMYDKRLRAAVDIIKEVHSRMEIGLQSNVVGTWLEEMNKFLESVGK